MKKNIPKDPADFDGTLDAVLTDVTFRNSNKRKLTEFEVSDTKIILTYEPITEDDV